MSALHLNMCTPYEEDAEFCPSAQLRLTHTLAAWSWSFMEASWIARPAITARVKKWSAPASLGTEPFQQHLWGMGKMVQVCVTEGEAVVPGPQTFSSTKL